METTQSTTTIDEALSRAEAWADSAAAARLKDEQTVVADKAGLTTTLLEGGKLEPAARKLDASEQALAHSTQRAITADAEVAKLRAARQQAGVASEIDADRVLVQAADQTFASESETYRRALVQLVGSGAILAAAHRQAQDANERIRRHGADPEPSSTQDPSGHVFRASLIEALRANAPAGATYHVATLTIPVYQ